MRGLDDRTPAPHPTAISRSSLRTTSHQVSNGSIPSVPTVLADTYDKETCGGRGNMPESSGYFDGCYYSTSTNESN